MIDPFDVIVCGGGTAGAVAAIAAAREGARTLVIEQLSSLGGTQSNGWVTPMMPNYIGDFKLSRGLNLEIIQDQAHLQTPGQVPHADEWYDPTSLALVLDRAAAHSGVTCLFNATLITAEVDQSRIKAVEIAARGGRFRFEGKTFIDCTGDAELCALAGAELMSGDETGAHQPLTLRFTLGNVNLETLRMDAPEILRINEPTNVECGFGEAKDGPMGPKIAAAIEAGILHEEDLGYFQFFTVNGRPGELAFNAPRLSGYDPLDPFEMSAAFVEGREKIHRIWQFMMRFYPGFENSYISVIAPLMGIRESRRVVGEYVLTEEDHQSCHKFPDAVARNRYPVDIHLKRGIDYRKFPPGEWHDIPYRSLVVKGFTNLWVAGRCLSADFVSQSSVRIQPVCRATGEAAGIAAALCAARALKSQELPYEQLVQKLDLRTPLQDA